MYISVVCVHMYDFLYKRVHHMCVYAECFNVFSNDSLLFFPSICVSLSHCCVLPVNRFFFLLWNTLSSVYSQSVHKDALRSTSALCSSGLFNIEDLFFGLFSSELKKRTRSWRIFWFLTSCFVIHARDFWNIFRKKRKKYCRAKCVNCEIKKKYLELIAITCDEFLFKIKIIIENNN